MTDSVRESSKIYNYGEYKIIEWRACESVMMNIRIDKWPD